MALLPVIIGFQPFHATVVCDSKWPVYYALLVLGTSSQHCIASSFPSACLFNIPFLSVLGSPEVIFSIAAVWGDALG